MTSCMTLAPSQHACLFDMAHALHGLFLMPSRYGNRYVNKQMADILKGYETPIPGNLGVDVNNPGLFRVNKRASL